VLNNEGQAATTSLLLSPVSAANTAAATSAWVNVNDSQGDLMFVVQNGALTGTCVWTIEHASDGSGTGAANIVPNEGAFATVTANSVQKRTVSANAVLGFVRVVGTIVTGPTLVSASVSRRPNIV